MGTLDELATAGQTPGRQPGGKPPAATPTPQSWSPGDAILHGFFVGVGIWIAFAICTGVVWGFIYFCNQLEGRR
jgi:hypothetical protein